MAEWQHRWDNSSKGREVFSILPLVKTTRVQGDFYLNLLLTGHGALAKYQARFLEKNHPVNSLGEAKYSVPSCLCAGCSDQPPRILDWGCCRGTVHWHRVASPGTIIAIELP
ncbi:hypothetical protein CEXT_417091 [Caerostris extrusa]|uniref:Uncharacterized protein n=1 Tax=Caerostris extrusa TaxID=172846 RepID=A0AAV4U3B0_CAEEX|nr:hypothetical protein CEXT_417091 [Caerostris extrusa]